MEVYCQIEKLFEDANRNFLQKDKELLHSRVSERTLCGALMLHIHDIIEKDEFYKSYHVDVEYNRNKGSIKTIYKTVVGSGEQIIPINCDLIVHSRGNFIEQDNLLAIEMKKSERPLKEKNKDRDRLSALTKDSFDDVWAWDGKNSPEHVCGYMLGVYYEINYTKNEILVEYYRKGEKVKSYTISY